MTCIRCHDDPQPEGMADPRRCAFDDAGAFLPGNWNCATIEALLMTQKAEAEFDLESGRHVSYDGNTITTTANDRAEGREKILSADELADLEAKWTAQYTGFPANLEFLGADESLQLVPAADEDEGGWIVLTRYKRRGTVSSAMHVGDFWPAQPLTLLIAERAIGEWS